MLRVRAQIQYQRLDVACAQALGTYKDTNKDTYKDVACVCAGSGDIQGHM